MDIRKVKQSSEKASNWLKSVAHKDRLFILCQLVGSELCVSDLLQNSHLSQSAFSQQLALLRKNGLVKTRKEAQTVYYSLADKDIIKLIKLLHKIFCP